MIVRGGTVGNFERDVDRICERLWRRLDVAGVQVSGLDSLLLAEI
jgi:hypothetical protein